VQQLLSVCGSMIFVTGSVTPCSADVNPLWKYFTYEFTLDGHVNTQTNRAYWLAYNPHKEEELTEIMMYVVQEITHAAISRP